MRMGESGPRAPRGATPKMCRIEVPFPPGSCVFEALSRAHDDLLVELNGSMVTGPSEVVVDVSLAGGCVSPEITAEMRSHSHVKEVVVLSLRRGRARYRVTKAICPVLRVFITTKVIPHFPFLMKGGTATIMVYSSEGSIRTLLDRLQRQMPGAHIVSVRSDDRRRLSLLTPHQSEVLKQAVLRGYYDVPRRTTLTELAVHLKISKSSLWETMATIEKKLLVAVSEEGEP